MNITQVIAAIRAQWAATLPETPLHLQIGPENAQVPFCVMNFGSISPADLTTQDRDYEVSVTFVCYSASDTECLARMDRISAAFDGVRFGVIYSSNLASAQFDFNYADQAALWSSEMPFSIRWNR